MTEETSMPSSRNPDRKVILVLISDLSAQVSLAIYIVFPVHRCLDFRDAPIILHSDSPDAWLVERALSNKAGFWPVYANTRLKRFDS